MLSAAFLGSLGLACGTSGEDTEQATSTASSHPFWTELCGAPVTRPASRIGERHPARAEYDALELEAARARACAPERSLLDAAAGVYRLAHIAAADDDDATFVRYLRLGALELADPLALGKLGRMEFRGYGETNGDPNTPLVAQNLHLSYVHIQAAMNIADGVRRETNNNELLTLVVSGTLGTYDTFQTAEIRRQYDVTARAADINRDVAAIEAQFQALHGVLPARN